MKITCQREQLLESLGLVEKISGKNSNLPVLTCVLLVADGNRLKLRTTNLELGIEVTIPVKLHKGGTLAAPASVLYSTIAAVSGSSPITLDSREGNLVVTTSTSTSLIKTQPHDDFPTLPVPKNPTVITLPAVDLLHGLRSVWYSASVSTIKPELASVYFYAGDNKLVFVATDSFRLAEKTIPFSKTPEFNPILIPFRNTSDIIRVLDGRSGEVTVWVNDNQISFMYDDLYLTSRLVDGTFPDYKQIIPQETRAEAVVLRQDLADAFKKLNIFSDRFNQVNISMRPSKKTLSLSAHNADVGETIERLNAALSGRDLDINFNHKYITDCFQSLVSDSVKLQFTDLAKPMIIRGVSDSSFLYLVMPMNR